MTVYRGTGPHADHDDRGDPAGTRILLASSDVMFMAGLRQTLEEAANCIVVGEATSGDDAVQAALDDLPDLVIVDSDLSAPGADEATRRIRHDEPSVSVIVLGHQDNDEAVFAAIRAGAAAFLLRSVEPADLISAVARVRDGEYLINERVLNRPRVASRVLTEFRGLAVYGASHSRVFAPLSPREVEILDRIAQGRTNKQVGDDLSISEQTVKNHVSSVLRKLSVNDRTQAVVYALREGLIQMPH